MNFEIIFVLAVLALAVYLFVTEKLPVDLVALLVMALSFFGVIDLLAIIPTYATLFLPGVRICWQSARRRARRQSASRRFSRDKSSLPRVFPTTGES